MIRQDYLLNMIEQFGVFFARAMNKDFSTVNFESEINAMADEWMDLPMSILLSASPEDVYLRFLEADRMVIEKCYIMALAHRAKGLIETDEHLRRDSYDNALFFFKKSSGQVDASLQKETDAYIAELSQ